MTTQTEFNAEVQRLVRLFAAQDTDEDEIWISLESHDWVAESDDYEEAHERLFDAVMQAS